jgi:hypothetical protein
MSRVKWVGATAILACTGALVAYGFTSQANAATTAAPAGAQEAAALDPSSVLSGAHVTTIVRAQAFESGVSLSDDGVLTEADDDSGRQLFVPTPVGGDRYLIKAYRSATDTPLCWQANNPDNGTSITVQGADCDEANADQLFSITREDDGTYAISNDDLYLQFSGTSGLILEELGDAPLETTFRINDNGPAPAA